MMTAEAPAQMIAEGSSAAPTHDGSATAHDYFARNRTNSQCHACGQFDRHETSCVHTAEFVTAHAWYLANSTEATKLSTAWKRAQATNPRPAARRFIAADDEGLTEATLDDALDAYAFDSSDFLLARRLDLILLTTQGNRMQSPCPLRAVATILSSPRPTV
jgi:hypothetical protein